MATLGSEGQWPIEFLISDEGEYSRANVTIVANAGAIPSGRMLGKITSGGKYDNYDAGRRQRHRGLRGHRTRTTIAASTVDQQAVIVARHAEGEGGDGRRPRTRPTRPPARATLESERRRVRVTGRGRGIHHEYLFRLQRSAVLGAPS
jgi:hypothetical protein